MMRCPMGNLAIKKKYHKECERADGYRNARMEYQFDKEKCKQCPMREKCLGKSKKDSKIYSVTILSETHIRQQEFENTDYFKDKLRYERYKIEAKNAETKVIYGLCKAKSVGLLRMCMQSYLAHITANLKRIVKKMDEVPA